MENTDETPALVQPTFYRERQIMSQIKNIEHMVVMVSAQEGNSREGSVESWLVEGLEFSLHSVAGEGLLRRCLWVEALKDVRPENGAESQ